MKKAISIALLVGCAATNAGAQGVVPAAKGTVASPTDQKLSTKPAAGNEDHTVKDKLTNAAFIEKATVGGLTEIEASHLAVNKSGSKSVRDFAATMIRDHTAANAKLRGIAEASGISIAGQLDATQVAATTQLAKLSGSAFDTEYINLMRRDHDAAVALFENAAGDPSLSDALRKFAAQTLDTLRNHQLQAHNLSINAAGP